jgi:hypothetical protein
MKTEKLKIIATLLANAETNLGQARELLKDLSNGGEDSSIYSHTPSFSISSTPTQGGDKVIEGVFDGESMIDQDMKKYSVPPNYASKSKLVFGDRLKLIVNEDGKFTFKQIGPVERSYTTGILVRDGSQFKVATGEKMLKVLPASVSYYRAELGDQVAIIIPADLESDWATIENIIPKDFTHSTQTSSNDDKDDSSPFELPKTLFRRKAEDE